MLKKIPLSNGQFALVDDADFKRLASRNWNVGTHGYACNHDGLMHRIVVGAPKGKVVDHINGDKLDNRQKNLRIVTMSENALNGSKHSDGVNPAKNIYWSETKQRWVVRISVRGKIYGGQSFQNIKDAIANRNEIYDREQIQYRPE